MLKKLSLILVLIVFTSILLGSTVLAQDYLDPNIPDSWFEAPATASEIGLTEFDQSPIFDERVAEGKLPPVEDRLPVDPPVIEPYEEIGKYGGKAIEWQAQMNWGEPWNGSELGGYLGWNRNMGRVTPDVQKIVPYIIKNWEYSEDYQTLTIHLREGVKWSDGHPFTTEDYMYWWDHIANNEDLNPVPPEQWKPPIEEVEQVDKYTVNFHMAKPSPYFHRGSTLAEAGRTTPKHFMKQFHPDFVGEEELQEKMDEAGIEEWFEYYEYRNQLGHPERGVRPTLIRPYVVVQESESHMLLERNPYFPFVDTEGNQLPYIDEVVLNLANDREMLMAKIATGEITWAGRDIDPNEIPLYKKYEDQSGIRTYIFQGLGKDWTPQLNLAHEDPQKKEIFQDIRFRKALSLGMNREDINNKVYYGKAIPRQATLMPGSKYIKPEYGEVFTEHKPEKAKRLLDEMGMKDVDGDGFRENLEGENFELLIQHWDPRATKIGELLRQDWQDIGIKTELKRNDISLVLQQAGSYKTEVVLNYLTPNDDLKFPVNTGSIAPVEGWPSTFIWQAWVNWYTTDGETGMEPPQEIKELQKITETLRFSTDEQKRLEAGRKITKSQAENLWVIGVVGGTPQPVVVDKNLKNVAKQGLIGAATDDFTPYYGIQTYLDE